MEKTQEKAQQSQQPKQYVVVEMRREIRSLHGIEYALVLTGASESADAILVEADKEEITEFQWWAVENTAQSKKLAESIAKNFLWKSTIDMPTHRMKDKYHQAELIAIYDIQWLLDSYAGTRFIWLFSEIKLYLWVMRKTMLRRIVFKIKKLFGQI
jgi:hypothetical protein